MISVIMPKKEPVIVDADDDHMKTLHFSYPSTARIRFKLDNVFKDDAFPYVYCIKTEKLDFLVPRKFTIISHKKKQAFIPLSYYQVVLTYFYLNIPSKQ